MKINNNYYIILSIILLLLNFSCQESFLENEPYDAVPFDQAITNENEMRDAMNGVYASIQSYESFGATIPLLGDIMADNVYISTLNSGRYVWFNGYIITANNMEPFRIWKSLYQSINRTNLVIDASVAFNPNIDQYRGEAYTIRALCYFQLIQIFAQPYSNASASNDGVPLVLNFDINATPARNTIAEVYDQIISDLEKGISLMSIEKNSEYVSPWVAKGLLAKVYQYMGDWQNAFDLAKEIVDNGAYQMVDSASFVEFWANPSATEKSGTLFEISLDESGNALELVGSLYSQEGYGDALCSDALYNIYSDSDVRKQLLFMGTHQGDSAIIVDKYKNVFSTTDDNIKILRLAEIYLILAEAYYHQSDETVALETLNLLAQMREPSFAGYASSGIELLNDITRERRKELAFEGNRFFDLNRLGLDVIRNEQYPPDAQMLPFSDHRRILPIPAVEMEANPNMTQNPGY